ncbi:unnamed protein product [Ostreobium quekettii]|uniref:Uncharacterized protein n=1 Tax=Ostreobium quekettii TaxID=121088 RepID=A0A8S1J967_9CHLO|nr:unnamed protein product [Ostreobium quekettii]|eukprot:evm.model.scf_604.3 EVM.evm.TU.scf_604.3   scf_604:30311-34179(-)
MDRTPRGLPPPGHKDGKAKNHCVDSAQDMSKAALARMQHYQANLEERIAKLRCRTPGMTSSMSELDSIKHNNNMMTCLREHMAIARDSQNTKNMSKEPRDIISANFERRRQLLREPTKNAADTTDAASKLCKSRKEVARIVRLIKSITRKWDVELTIDTIIPGRYRTEDEQYLQNLLSYIIKGESCDLGDELLLEDWDEIRHHLMKGLQVISDAEAAKEKREAGGEGSTYEAKMPRDRVVVKKVAKGSS